MRSLRAFFVRLVSLLHRRRLEEDLAMEIESHLQMHIDDNLKSGMTPEEARRHALFKLGGIESTKESYRVRLGLPLVETTASDLGFGARLFRQSPLFAFITILSLALAIGANVAVFSTINAVLFRPLPYKEAERIVLVRGHHPQREGQSAISPADWLDWQTRNTVFEEMGAYTDTTYTLTNAGEPESLVAYNLTTNFFHLLGVQPALGRTFRPEDSTPGRQQVVILSHRLWQRHFGGDIEIVGKRITLDDQPYTVIGVMPPSFFYSQLTELWTPLVIEAGMTNNRSLRFLHIVARLKPAISVNQAQARMTEITRDLEAQHPDTNSKLGVSLIGLTDDYSASVKPVLLILMVVAILALLIACTNAVGVLLARTNERQKEFALNRTKRTGRLRLVRKLVAEGLLLSMIGGLAGFIVALGARRLILSLFAADIANLNLPKIETIPIDAQVVFLSIAMTLLIGIIFGVVSSLPVSTSNLGHALWKTAGSLNTDRRLTQLRGSLVVIEIAIATVLLLGAGLLLRSFARLTREDLGFNSHRVLTMYLSFKPREVEERSTATFVEEVLNRTSKLPGVEAVGGIDFLPLSGFQRAVPFEILGGKPSTAVDESRADYRAIIDDYFDTMGMRLILGRKFMAQDRSDGPQVAIVNQTLARRIFGTSDGAIGKHLKLGNVLGPDECEIVGIVNDVKSDGPDQPVHAEIYRPYFQSPTPFIALTIRTSTDPSQLMDSVKKIVWSVNKDQPLQKVLTMEQLTAENLAVRRVSMLILMVLSGVALILALGGIYGVTDYALAQRTDEEYVRMALGVPPSDVVSLIVKQGIGLTLYGISLGTIGALVLSRSLSSLLYGVSPTDPLAFTAIVISIVFMILLAAYFPARRVLKTTPMTTLRCQ